MQQKGRVLRIPFMASPRVIRLGRFGSFVPACLRHHTSTGTTAPSVAQPVVEPTGSGTSASFTQGQTASSGQEVGEGREKHLSEPGWQFVDSGDVNFDIDVDAIGNTHQFVHPSEICRLPELTSGAPFGVTVRVISVSEGVLELLWYFNWDAVHKLKNVSDITRLFEIEQTTIAEDSGDSTSEATQIRCLGPPLRLVLRPGRQYSFAVCAVGVQDKECNSSGGKRESQDAFWRSPRSLQATADFRCLFGSPLAVTEDGQSSLSVRPSSESDVSSDDSCLEHAPAHLERWIEISLSRVKERRERSDNIDNIPCIIDQEGVLVDATCGAHLQWPQEGFTGGVGIA